MGKKGFAALFFLFVSSLGAAAEESKISGFAGVGVFNKYVFRGYEFSDRSIVIQPSLGMGYRDFSLTFWGNMDTKEHPTQSFTPDRPGKKSFNETDVNFSYSRSVGKIGLTGGYAYYGTKYVTETEELYLSLSYDTYAKPTLSIYRDIASFPGTYINLALSQSWKIYKENTLDLSGSVGYFAGDSGYWKTFDSSTGGYTGEKYRAFHDGMISAGFTMPIGRNFVVQPIVQYWFPLSDKAKRTVDGRPYNPNGRLEDTFIGGVNIKLSF